LLAYITYFIVTVVIRPVQRAADLAATGRPVTLITESTESAELAPVQHTNY